MSKKKYKVTLTEDLEENLLHNIVNRGKHGAQNGSGPRLCSLLMKDTPADLRAVSGCLGKR
jgi:hypothetical protein